MTWICDAKSLSPNLVREEGIDICANEENPSKEEYPIEVTEEGIVIVSNDEQLAKAHPPIEVKWEGF